MANDTNFSKPQTPKAAKVTPQADRAASGTLGSAGNYPAETHQGGLNKAADAARESVSDRGSRATTDSEIPSSR